MDLDVQDTTTAGGSTPWRTRSFIVSGSLALSILSGTGTAAAMPTMPVALTVVDGVTGTGGYPAALRPAHTQNASATALRRLRTQTGLSWDHLAKIVGVSRRTVHKWANGGSMNAQHGARLAELTTVLGELRGAPQDIRARILAPDAEGVTLLQHLIRTAQPAQIKPEGFAVEDLMGVRRDGDVTVQGALVEVIDLDGGWPQPAT